MKAAGVCAVPPTILYITPHASPLPALDSPATEVFVATFPPDASADAKAAWEPAMPTLLREGKAQEHGMRAEAGAWMAGGIPYSKVGPEGSTAWAHLVGWGNVAEHKAFRESDGFKEHVHLIRGKGQSATDMFHILKI